MTVTVVPADPREKFLAWLRPLLPTILPDVEWTAGTSLPADPAHFVQVVVLGGGQDSPISDQVTLALKLWGSNGLNDDHERVRAARVVTAHAQRGVNARRTSAAITLPDPANPERSITQITITARFRGEDQ